MRDDLSGDWLGRYAYDGDRLGEGAVAFEARLADEGGALTGTVREPNTFLPGGPAELRAEIVGAAAGGGVSFRKHYPGQPDGEDPIYDGTVSGDGRRIAGRWRIAGNPGFGGGFTMVRKPRMATRAAVREAVEAGI